LIEIQIISTKGENDFKEVASGILFEIWWSSGKKCL